MKSTNCWKDDATLLLTLKRGSDGGFGFNKVRKPKNGTGHHCMKWKQEAWPSNIDIQGP